jgi:hypothetical protein
MFSFAGSVEVLGHFKHTVLFFSPQVFLALQYPDLQGAGGYY